MEDAESWVMRLGLRPHVDGLGDGDGLGPPPAPSPGSNGTSPMPAVEELGVGSEVKGCD